MIFGGLQSRQEILVALQSDEDVLENVIAMANVGAAFTAISVFEDLVAAIVMASRAKIESKLNPEAVSRNDLFLDRHKQVRGSTLGRLVTVLEESGFGGRDLRYLRGIVELRNDFIHRLMEQVPLPGDWEKSDYGLEEFSEYTRYVIRHVSFARENFSKMMHRSGLVGGVWGSFGALLWHPDFPLDVD